MALTVQTLTRCGVPEATARAHLPHMTRAMRRHGITTRPRARAFLATVLHESLALRRMDEIGGGAKYEGRAGLGNRRPGDGERFKGRGPIQLTGRANYETYGRALGLDLVGRPELVATPKVGWEVAACYFAKRPGLLAAADAGDFRRVTLLVNGGYNGWEDRRRYWRLLGPLGVVPGPAPVKRGARGREVERLSRRLSRTPSPKTGRPYLDGPRSRFDRKTARALKSFQRDHGLRADGVLDGRSAAVLDAAAPRAPKRTPAVSGPSPVSVRPAPALARNRAAALWERLERIDRAGDRLRAELARASRPPADRPGALPAGAPAALSDADLVAALERVDGEYDALRAVLAGRVAERQQPACDREALAAIAGDLEQLAGRVRTMAAPPAPSSDAAQRLDALDAEAGTLRAELAQRLLETGGGASAAPAARPPATGRYLEVLARLDALDARADRIRRALRGAPVPANGNGQAPAPKAARTFRRRSPEMTGDDVRAWQRHLNRRLRLWKVAYEVAVDGEYGPETERWSKRVLHGLGLATRDWDGVTPEARIKVRQPERRTPQEVAAAGRRRAWVRELRRRHRRPAGVKAAIAYAKLHADRRTAEVRVNGGPFIDDWCRMVHLQPGTSWAHWCGAFANACLVEAGLPSRDWLRYTPSIVANAKRGVEGWSWHARPRVGDLVLFDWPGGEHVDHVGIVVEVHGDGSVTTVEGNFQNRVGYWRRRSQIAGYARPPWGQAAGSRMRR